MSEPEPNLNLENGAQVNPNQTWTAKIFWTGAKPEPLFETVRHPARNLIAEQFLDDLQTELTDMINTDLDNKDTNALFTEFTNKFFSILDWHAPSQKMTRKQRKLNQKPWINKEILNLIRIKTELYKQFLTGSKEAEKLYKEVRNKLTHIKELAKKQYYNVIIDKAKHNTALIWKVINDILKYKV